MSRRMNTFLVLARVAVASYGRFGVPFLLPLLSDQTEAMIEEQDQQGVSEVDEVATAEARAAAEAVILQREAALQQAKADLLRWQRELKRAEDLMKKGIYDRATLNQVACAFESCKRQMVDAKAALAKARLDMILGKK